ncbi:DUF5819 family protein [Streptomyces thermoviolaceus]|uniref:DUF5819 family protein n=1 Tax=Streptomyces thermoviolaceus TaxID=1952 RepID=UPI0033BE0BA4
MDAYDGDPGAPAGPGGRTTSPPVPGQRHETTAGSGERAGTAGEAGPEQTAGQGRPETTGPEAPGAAGPVPRYGTAAAEATDAEPGPETLPTEAAGSGRTGRQPVPATGLAALSPRFRAVAAVAAVAVAVVACVHLGMVFLSVAPANTLSKRHGDAVDAWVYPEFEQNWKLFAPNPLQQNITVQVRAQVRSAAGETFTTGWYDLSAQDGRDIRGNLLPSHTQQNELRRAVDFYAGTHDGANRPAGLRGELSQAYLRRIAVLRLEREHAAKPQEELARIQVRIRSAAVAPPPWSEEKASTEPVDRLLPWWTVPAGEAGGGVR